MSQTIAPLTVHAAKPSEKGPEALWSVRSDGATGFGLRLFLPGMRIGILGGSFNPAHAGHRHISIVALRRLQLDGLVWLLSPQNPLKPAAETASMKDRVARAQAVARHPHILVSDLECRLHTQYTADTLPALCRRFPQTRFVWIMGADNLIQLPRWQHWTRIMGTMPVAVIDRPGYGLQAQLGKVAQIFRGFRLAGDQAARLPFCEPPAWVYLHAKLNPLSASLIREQVPPGMSWTDLAFSAPAPDDAS